MIPALTLMVVIVPLTVLTFPGGMEGAWWAPIQPMIKAPISPSMRAIKQYFLIPLSCPLNLEPLTTKIFFGQWIKQPEFPQKVCVRVHNLLINLKLVLRGVDWTHTPLGGQKMGKLRPLET